MLKARILLTTPDYPPKKIGGLSTFTLNLETNLKSMGLEYDLLVWNSLNELKGADFDSYDLVLNVHFMPALKIKNTKYINFVHGGEIFPYSPNLLKRLLKKIFQKKITQALTNATYNIFISESSFNIFKSLGKKIDYSRDLIYHNTIDLAGAKFIDKEWNQELQICCFARNVPHKNLNGCVELYKQLKKRHPFGAKLYITSDTDYGDPDIINLGNISDSEREEVLKRSHLNFLLSLDHSSKGQIEGFGLTVLEAGKYGVPSISSTFGGLPESVHHKITGWNLVLNNKQAFEECYSFFELNYLELREKTYHHTIDCHRIEMYQKLLESII